MPGSYLRIRNWEKWVSPANKGHAQIPQETKLL